MSSNRRTVIVTGASQGIGAAVARAFLDRGWAVVAGSRRITSQRTGPGEEPPASDALALVDGDVAGPGTAERLVATAVDRFGSVDALVNNAGLFVPKPFTDYTTDELRALVATNVDGFVHTTQAVVRQMLAQDVGGSVVSISASVADHPLATMPASVPMITKGGINAITRSLALEYAGRGIRVNAVAPGAVATPLLAGVPEEALRAMSPMGRVAEARDVAEAVLFLTEARQVTGEVLHVDGGMHVGHW